MNCVHECCCPSGTMTGPLIRSNTTHMISINNFIYTTNFVSIKRNCIVCLSHSMNKNTALSSVLTVYPGLFGCGVLALPVMCMSEGFSSVRQQNLQ